MCETSSILSLKEELNHLKQELTANKAAAAEASRHIQKIDALNRKLADSNRAKDLILQNSSTSMILISPDFNILWTNGAMNKLCNLSGDYLKVRKCYDILKSDICKTEKCHVLKALKEKKPLKDEFHVTINGGRKLCIVCASPIYDDEGNITSILQDFTDIMEFNNLEKEILKLQKLNSLSILAGGIAHDFNNYLTAIIGNISLAMMMEQNSQILDILKEAERSSIMAKELTRQLLAFSRSSIPVKECLSVRSLLEESVKFALMGSNVRSQFNIEENIQNIEADRSQLSQVINTVVINARQAMPSGGIIKVSAENIALDDNRSIPLKKGNYVKMTIEDSGIGIPEEYLSRIFEPCFTTKQQGSGLGLAIAHSIIKKHHGFIRVESVNGEKTTVEIFFPVSQEELKRDKEYVTVKENGNHSGSGKILIMDDNTEVRTVLGRMLQHLGLEVSYADDGTIAMELYEEEMRQGKKFDIVICDLTIPGGMGGKETLGKLLEIDPEVKVVASSGYTDSPEMTDYKNLGFCGFIPKPYQLKDVGSVLKGMLKKK